VLLACLPAALFAQQPSCPFCTEAAGLMRRFDLRETEAPVRERAGWAVPRKIVTIGGEEWAALFRAAAPDAQVVGVADAGDALAVLGDADVYVGPCFPAVLRAGKRLTWIQLTTAGADQCAPTLAEAEHPPLLSNAQGLLGPNVADHAMALLLSLTRGLGAYQAHQRAGVWRPEPEPGDAGGGAMIELDGKNMLVTGLGGIGVEIARRAHAFGMHVRATRTSARATPEFLEYVGRPEETLELARWADVVVNAAPLTPATRGMFDSRFFAAMKPTAYFINIGRGESVVTDALVAVLRDHGIAGAGLDVTAPEPLPPGHPLWSLRNVVITPHVAGESDQDTRRVLLIAAENLRRYVNGERMLSVVDPRRGY
jgi:phosphoglycerate dehydrogenase-like enzyme